MLFLTESKRERERELKRERERLEGIHPQAGCYISEWVREGYVCLLHTATRSGWVTSKSVNPDTRAFVAHCLTYGSTCHTAEEDTAGPDEGEDANGTGFFFKLVLISEDFIFLFSRWHGGELQRTIPGAGEDFNVMLKVTSSGWISASLNQSPVEYHGRERGKEERAWF